MPSLRPTSPAPLHARLSRRAVSLATVGGLVLGALLSACADVPSAPRATPAPAPSHGLISSTLGAVGSTLSTVTGLLWTVPATSTTVTQVIGPEGGSFAIPNGVRVTVPRGAVSRDVSFSVTRLPGLVVAYDFQPHGTTFAVPLTIEQPATGTNLLGVLRLLPTSSVEGAYFADGSSLDQLLGTARVSEFVPTTVSADRSTISFQVRHFSGYMVSTGRR